MQTQTLLLEVSNVVITIENNRRNNDAEDVKSKIRIKQMKMNEKLLNHL